LINSKLNFNQTVAILDLGSKGVLEISLDCQSVADFTNIVSVPWVVQKKYSQQSE